MTTTEATATYVLAVDWTRGRTPTYERHIAWQTTEANARRFYEMNRHQNAMGCATALIGPDGSVLVSDG